MLLKAAAPCIEMRYSGQAWQQVYTAAPEHDRRGMQGKPASSPRWNRRRCLMSPVMKRRGMIPKNKAFHVGRVYILLASFYFPLLSKTQLSKHRCLSDFLPLANFLFPLPNTICL